MKRYRVPAPGPLVGADARLPPTGGGRLVVGPDRDRAGVAGPPGWSACPSAGRSCRGWLDFQCAAERTGLELLAPGLAPPPEHLGGVRGVLAVADAGGDEDRSRLREGVGRGDRPHHQQATGQGDAADGGRETTQRRDHRGRLDRTAHGGNPTCPKWVRTDPAGWSPRTSRDADRSGVDPALPSCLAGGMTRTLAVDYLVVGAGAAGMAFTDALVDHSDARVVMVDRRDGPGGHWLDAYPFVRLHQASAFYGVASTPLGDGRVQEHGPETGLHERATVAEISAYYARVLADRMLRRAASSSCRAATTSARAGSCRRVSGERPGSPPAAGSSTPATSPPRSRPSTPPPFEVADGARVVPVNDLARLAEPPAGTSSSAPARPRPTPSSGYGRAEWTPARSAGCAPATRGC